MYELEHKLKEFFQNLIDWFTTFFTKIAIYLLIGVIIVIFLTIVILVIRSLMTKERYIEKGRELERQESVKKK